MTSDVHYRTIQPLGGYHVRWNVWRFPKINSDQLNMESLSCDGYICGIRNILIRNSVVNREMKCVRINGQTQLEVRRGVWPKTINAVGITQMVGVFQTSGRIPWCRLVNYRAISSVGNEFLIGISCFAILQPALFTTLFNLRPLPTAALHHTPRNF